MLSPDYFTGKADKVVDYYRELEDYMLKDIANFLLNGEIGGKADRELFNLLQMNMSNNEIVSKLSKISKLSKREVKKLLQSSVMTSFSNDKKILEKYFNGNISPMNRPTAIKIMDAEWIKTCGELDNLTNTTMMQHNKDVVDLLNQAEFRTATGTQSYSSAICDVLDAYAKKGMVIDYPSGARRSLESAVQCAVLTSMNQTAAQVTNSYIAEGGIEYVLITAHTGARHDKKHPEGYQSHDWWQGKAFKIRGSEPGYPNLLESTGYNIDITTGKGTVVHPEGLHGYNCRHSHSPWDKEFENPWIDEKGNPRVDPEESQKKFELQQQQRTIERSIRSYKRQLLVKQVELESINDSELKEQLQGEYDSIAYKLRMKNADLDNFCKEHDLQKQFFRTKAAGFGKAESRKANGRATVYQNENS